MNRVPTARNKRIHFSLFFSDALVLSLSISPVACLVVVQFNWRFVAGLTKRCVTVAVVVLDSLCFISLQALFTIFSVLDRIVFAFMCVFYIIFFLLLLHVFFLSFSPSCLFILLLLGRRCRFTLIYTHFCYITLRLLDTIFILLVLTKCIFGMWQIICMAFGFVSINRVHISIYLHIYTSIWK